MPDKIFILKFIKFCIVGASGMIIDFGTTWFLKEKIHLNKYFANSSGFILAATSNYFLNRIWTFSSADPNIAAQYTTFVFISLFGLGINNLVIYYLHGKIRINFYVAKLFAIIVVTVWNFSMNFLITFRPQ